MIKIESATANRAVKRPERYLRWRSAAFGAMVRPAFFSTLSSIGLAEQIIRIMAARPTFKGSANYRDRYHGSTMPWSTVFPTPT